MTDRKDRKRAAMAMVYTVQDALRRWDPIGVQPGEDGPADEYDSYAPRRLRSPTAERVFAEYPGVATIAAGTNTDATTPLSGDLIEWADIIFVMEESHGSKLTTRFAEQLRAKRLVVLAIPDHFDFMDPELVALLKVRVAPHIGGS